MIQLAILTLLIAYLVWRDLHARQERRDFIALIETQNQRIQAPGVAVQQHAAGDAAVWAPPAVGMDDDEAHWKSKETLAEMLADH